MYPAFDWSLLCSGPSWISARVRSHYRIGLNGPCGSPVFACAGKTDPPSRFSPLADLGRQGVSTIRVESCGLNLAGLEGLAVSQDAPSNAGELVGERDGKDVVMQSLLRRFDPRLEPIALPML